MYRKIMILTPNVNNKDFLFTKEELEKLLDKAYDEGYQDGVRSMSTVSTMSYNPYSNSISSTSEH